MKKINLPVAICLSALLIFLGLIVSQSMKQNSIERQQKIKIEAEKEKTEKEELDEIYRKIDLNACLEEADDDYWDYMKLNGTEKDDGTVWASDRFWNNGEKNKEADEDLCFKKYK